jgi:hypothetical protein
LNGEHIVQLRVRRLLEQAVVANFSMSVGCDIRSFAHAFEVDSTPKAELSSPVISTLQLSELAA